MSVSSPVDLLIRGRVRAPNGSWVRGSVGIAGERIASLSFDDSGSESTHPEAHAARTIDVGEAFVLPGAVDAHVHSYSHPGEGIEASTSAAAGGGVTTVVEMPFDAHGPVNSRDRIRAKQDRVADGAHIDVALLGTLAPGGGWRATDELVDEGAVGFKVSLFLTDGTRFPRIDDRELLHVMRATADVGRTLCVHAENNEIVKAMLAEEERASRAGDPHAHTRSRPPVAETLGTLTALEIAATIGARLHVCHLSLPRSVDLVGWYQDQGVDVTLETCPHYLTFTSDDLESQHGRLKINPPLRGAADRDALWRQLRGGQIDVVSSDHAPWSADLKDHRAILDNHSGVPGVETLVAVTLGEALRFDDGMKTFNRAVDALTSAPAERFGLSAQKGSLAVGKDADIMVFQPSASFEIDAEDLHSRAGWSPYSGRRPGGRVIHTISRGREVWSVGGGLVSRAGMGRILGTRT